jgi:HEPN domain-containing protein
MNSLEEIKSLAKQRLEEAIVLHKNSLNDGAFYLAGYSVELSLKAKICENFGIPNLFDELNSSVNAIKGIGEIRKMLKTHNLYLLLIVSGLKNNYDEAKSENIFLSIASSYLFGTWDENIRYKPYGFVKENELKNILTLLYTSNGILSWIEKKH